MGFWSALGTIGGLAAAPFTGGASIPLMMSIGGAAGGLADAATSGGGGGSSSNFWKGVDPGALSQLLLGASSGAARGRVEQGQYENARDAQALRNAQFQASLPALGANEAVRGSILQNAQDVWLNIAPGSQLGSHLVSFTGGTRPSLLTPEARAAGRALVSHGASMVEDPSKFVPAQSKAIEPGFWSQAAGIGGLGLGALDAITGGGSRIKQIMDQIGRGETAKAPALGGPNNTYGDFPPTGTPMVGAGQGSPEDPYDVGGGQTWEQAQLPSADPEWWNRIQT